jgi:hypothetical protein
VLLLHCANGGASNKALLVPRCDAAGMQRRCDPPEHGCAAAQITRACRHMSCIMICVCMQCDAVWGLVQQLLLAGRCGSLLCACHSLLLQMLLAVFARDVY